jgi:hypothetical protein
MTDAQGWSVLRPSMPLSTSGPPSAVSCTQVRCRSVSRLASARDASGIVARHGRWAILQSIVLAVPARSPEP